MQIATSLSWLPPILLGAALALIAQLVIQRLVVPAVEARKRREDRWERDVLALGELLTTELPIRTEAVRRDLWLLHTINVSFNTGHRDIDPVRRDQVVRELREKAEESVISYKTVADTRVKWLVDRIVSIQPEAERLVKLKARWRGFHVGAIGVSLWDHVQEEFDEEKFREHWVYEKKVTTALTDEITLLARDLRPPRKPHFRRVRRTYASARSALGRKSVKGP
ncbi:hypothetical protein [Nonomuraea sp. NPDC023979]|uniref:hypothetical protein n=1 Tax=Nonomuraea sp. NPDC023979 TaxID=3154796 RepID=UPI003400BEBC